MQNAYFQLANKSALSTSQVVKILMEEFYVTFVVKFLLDNNLVFLIVIKLGVHVNCLIPKTKP